MSLTLSLKEPISSPLETYYEAPKTYLFTKTLPPSEPSPTVEDPVAPPPPEEPSLTLLKLISPKTVADISWTEAAQTVQAKAQADTDALFTGAGTTQADFVAEVQSRPPPKTPDELEAERGAVIMAERERAYAVEVVKAVVEQARAAFAREAVAVDIFNRRTFLLDPGIWAQWPPGGEIREDNVRAFLYGDWHQFPAYKVGGIADAARELHTARRIADNLRANLEQLYAGTYPDPDFQKAFAAASPPVEAFLPSGALPPPAAQPAPSSPPLLLLLLGAALFGVF
jgi:hypothetical protein